MLRSQVDDSAAACSVDVTVVVEADGDPRWRGSHPGALAVGLADLRGMALSSAVTQLAGGRWGCSHQRSRELLSLLKAVKPVHFQRA
ncbi:MAG: hypothetical protein U0904_07275, partial [Candidatus Nanopelagicales bacterium]|nr:hypothetical protein [Candidatus Nanopelagicales bacterium]